MSLSREAARWSERVRRRCARACAAAPRGCRHRGWRPLPTGCPPATPRAGSSAAAHHCRRRGRATGGRSDRSRAIGAAEAPHRKSRRSARGTFPGVALVRLGDVQLCIARLRSTRAMVCLGLDAKRGPTSRRSPRKHLAPSGTLARKRKRT
eukprot:6253640-Prymnesium_polylepis.3